MLIPEILTKALFLPEKNQTTNVMTKESAFIFKSCRYESEKQCVFLDYAMSSGLTFTEVISFPGAKTNFSSEEQAALKGLMHVLHLAAGISYYKACCPPRIIIEDRTISRTEADFFYKFYLMGLGEFSVKNNLDLRGIINFPVTEQTAPQPSPLILPRRNVLPIGGGKDSLVSLEILRQAGQDFRPIAINAGRPILEVMARGDCPDPILITRKIDPRLFQLNEQGAYNGHVPISGILGFIMAFAAVLYGYNTVIMSNEQSANEGNMVKDGLRINHQYSKSLEFEQDFSQFITRHVMKNFRYFSLLRPLSESGIAALFAREPKYFSTFRSCNRNFHILQEARKYGWCCDCPKCRFVYLALAPFMEKADVVRIFGQDMLNDVTQEDGFRELLGLKGHKPFECVGEIGECRLLLKSLALMPQWQDSALIARLAPEIDETGLNLSALTAKSLKKHAGHNLPMEFERMLDDFIGS
ncbi:MAG: hypothetical protein COB49_10550 [Alphaproteobacteria bacterium]|nr:MAG: hypothetical protein COB49_10550 [Alphaproteobacteria bacterium]